MALKHAEVIYETGSHAVVSYEDLQDLKNSLAEQQRRAISGEPGGPTGHPAERIKQVLLYTDHPGDYMYGGLVTVDKLKSDLPAMIDHVAVGDQVSVWEVISQLRQYMGAIIPVRDASPHDSIFKMQEDGTLDLE